MAVQVMNRPLDLPSRLMNSTAQPMIEAGATTNRNGVRNGRTRLGSVKRRIITPSDTAAKADQVPEFEESASWPTGRKAAKIATTSPVTRVMIQGVLNLGCTVESTGGR